MSTPAPRRGGRGSVPDMVRSLAVVLLLVGAVALITIRSGDDGPRVVDYSTQLASAREAAPYDVLAPVGLDDYLATSVRYDATPDGTVWHLGFVTPDEGYAGLDQTDGDAEAFVELLTEGATPVAGDEVTLGGRSWQRYDEGGDQDDEVVRGLLDDSDGAVTLVSGTAEWDELEELAGALSDG